jgi:hypothetical protein
MAEIFVGRVFTSHCMYVAFVSRLRLLIARKSLENIHLYFNATLFKSHGLNV